MIYKGKAIQVVKLESGIAKLTMDLPDSAVNVFNRLMLADLKAAVAAIAASDALALVIVSAKGSFVAGADITEFTEYFRLPEQELLQWAAETNSIFNELEDLPIPTVCAINGLALGGGLELCLATDFRVASEKAVLGFPEVKLGICPGFGGTVRAPRLIGLRHAVDWVITGKNIKAAQALEVGAVDAVVAHELLLDAALDMLSQCLEGNLNYLEARTPKLTPLAIPAAEVEATVEELSNAALAESKQHYPSPVVATHAMCEAIPADRAEALQLENQAFVELAKSSVAGNLVQLFLNEQFLKRQTKKMLANSKPVKRAAVIGAGIMGGGIAYQSAVTGTPIVMKDIAQQGLDLGTGEAQKQLKKQLAKGRISEKKMLEVMSAIVPTLDYELFAEADLVVEAVIENTGIKQNVLAEVETRLRDDAVLTSNTSTISISLLAKSLQRPQNFCGMHFFNPVPLMPLVEVIRGENSSEQTLATTMAFGQSLGKTPILVNDCPGFLVNRILFPYFGAFSQLVYDGADFREIDRVMEAFGWPMGPAYLLDVVGIDTAAHAQNVMAEGIPQRMRYEFKTAIDLMHENGCYGQKTGSGFYKYEVDKSGRVQKIFDESILMQLQSIQKAQKQFSDQEIIDRMMLALCLETVRCLEDNIIGTAIEADMGLILGLGFPRFRGGALRYIDSVGSRAFCEMADRYAELGPLYLPTAGLRKMAETDQKFYS